MHMHVHPLTCGMCMRYLQVCASLFSEVWEQPPKGMGSKVIAEQCPRSCGRCGK